jgi:hypothetical protein
MMKNDIYLPDRTIKRVMADYLTARGWEYTFASVASHGTEIEAKRGVEGWVIEVKSTEYLTFEIINSFVITLGRVLQRMDNTNHKYSIALPDSKPFRRLWDRLPVLAKKRTGITALFIGRTGIVDEVNA